MEFHQNETLMTLRHIQTFLDTNTAALGTVNTTGARADLDASVVQLTARAVTQKQSTVQAQGETSNQKTLRTALLENYMAPIAAMARAKLGATPNLSSLTMPKRTVHSQALITAADAMANSAAAYSAIFVGQGLPVDFVAQLQAAAAALQTSLDSRAALKNTGMGATVGARAEVTTARNVIGVLNTLVAPLLAGNPTLLAQWKNIKRVTNKPGVALGSTQTTPTTPTSVAGSGATVSPMVPAHAGVSAGAATAGAADVRVAAAAREVAPEVKTA